MKTRVIHSRIDVETLVSTIEFYEQQGGAKSDALSTKVSLTLATLMRHMRETGQMEKHESRDIEAKLNEYLQDPLLGGPINLRGIEGLVIEEPSALEEPPTVHTGRIPFTKEASHDYSATQQVTNVSLQEAVNPRDRMRELIESSVNAITQPAPELDPDIWKPDPMDLPEVGEFEMDVEKQAKLNVKDLPPLRDEVVNAITLSSGRERDIQFMLCRIIFAYDIDIPADQFSQLAAQLRPHVESYLEGG